MPAQFRVPTTWLVNALQIIRGSVPQYLGDGAMPIVDITGRGYALGTWERINASVAAGAAAGDVDIVAADADVIRIVHSIRVRHDGGAVAAEISIMDWLGSSALGGSLRGGIWGIASVAVNNHAGNEDYLVGGPGVVAPGWTLAALHGGTAVGETLSFTGCMISMPAGFPAP